MMPSLWTVGGLSDEIRLFNPSTGAVTDSFASPSNGPFGLALDSSGCLWHTDRFADSIYKLNQNGSIVQQNSTIKGGTRGITVEESTGCIWVTDINPADHEVITLTPTNPPNVTASFKMPYFGISLFDVQGISLDRESSVWIGDVTQKAGVRYTQSGSFVTAFSGPDKTRMPGLQAQDNKGSVWYPDQDNGTYRQFDKSGRVSLETPSYGTSPLGVTTVDEPLVTYESNSFWRVGATSPTNLTELTSEKATHKSLELIFQTGSPSTLQQFDVDSGKVEDHVTRNGQFFAQDLASGDNTFTLIPPSQRDDLRKVREYCVDTYNETVIDQQADKYEINITFIPKRPKFFTSVLLDETRASDEWGFEFPDEGQGTKTVATQRVSSDVTTSSKGSVTSVELSMFLTTDQAQVFEEYLCRGIEATRTRVVPDGTDVTEDNTSSNTNTIALTVPQSNSAVPDDDYVAREYTTEWINDGYHRVSVKLDRKF